MKNKIAWRSPSNIALIKYWGKYGQQIPANPSISFTLDACFTETEISWSEKKTDDAYSLEVRLDGEPQEDFKPKIIQFFDRIKEDASFLNDYHLSIQTHNSFPHSSGIASSASGMSALALGLLSMKEQVEDVKIEHFHRKASEWARLGSGSASRSLYGGLAEWGRFNELQKSSDEYAIPYEGKIDPVFEDFRDYVLLVEVGSKSVSSSAGHGLMKDHPYAERRFLQAHQNMAKLLEYMGQGDLDSFGRLVESEALTLHAMMMTSDPYYLLMKPNTLQVIEKIWSFRKDTSQPLYFTLDAGANVHLLFPASIEPLVEDFVKSSLSGHLKNGQYIRDRVGNGPQKIG